LENTSLDIPKVFGASSPEANQLNADTNPFKDAESADYVGISGHCPGCGEFCASAMGVRFGQTSPSKTQAPDLLPSEPGGYNNFNALHGHRYIAPQLGAGTPNVALNGYKVTNAQGNLVDLSGNEIDGAFLSPATPGFPGFGDISPSQTLAYVSDLQESGVPVTYGYISDVHGNHHLPGLSAQCDSAPDALPSGDPCYIAQAQQYDAAFAQWFKRLAADGITPANTLFV